MDQHPVPQNITSYEFRLVGDMTLKQFFQLAGGGIVGVVIYQLPLPFFVKWPLIFVAVGIGAALAFVPVQGRPFSQWLTAFFGAIYAPTEYYWSPSPPTPTSVSPYVGGEQRGGTLDQFEANFFKKISQLFSSLNTSNTTPISIPTTTKTPQEVVEEKEIKKVSIPAFEETQTFVQAQKTEDRTRENVVYETQTPIVAPQAAPQAVPALTTNLVPEPSYPNILTGLIKDPTDISLEGAIVEIVDSATGIPARALRTNKLGQFQIATPLSNGSYTIIVDKQGFSFNPVLVQAEGTIIKPILIKAS